MDFIVAVDGSAEARQALAYATDVADGTGGTLTAVHVVAPTLFDTGGRDPAGSFSETDRRLVLESVEDAEDRGIEHLEEAAAFAEELGCDIETELLYGDPVVELTDYAADREVDGIVLGHRGLSERAETMVGSVAKAVVERATVPVTVVR